MSSSGSSRPKRRRTRIFSSFRGEWPAVVLSAGVASLAAVAEAAGLILVVLLAASLNGGTAKPVAFDMGPLSAELSFSQAAVAALSAIAVSAAARIVANYITVRRRTEIARRWRNDLVAGYLDSNFEFSSNLRRGEVLETTGQHVSTGAQALEVLANALNSIMSMLVLAGAAFALDPVVASTLLLGGALLLLALRPLTVRARRLSEEVAQFDVEFGNQLEEMVGVAREIKLFDAAAQYQVAARRYARRMSFLARRVLLYNRSVPIAFQTLGLLLLIVALAVASAAGGASITAIGGTALLLMRGISYGQKLSTFQQSLANALPYVDRVIEQRKRYKGKAETFGELQLDRVETIELDRVTYEYAPDVLPAVDDVQLTIKERGITGLVGPSGSGKSTIAQLILRLRQPTHGVVKVNGIDVLEFDPKSWRRTVSFVPQEASLIHATVAENVRFFREWVTRDEVEAVIDAVGLTGHIESLPQGYDTPIGPTVRDFSGGQKQRIGIARALVTDPSLFVLDEPTSALDAESEEWIMRTLDNVRGSRIAIIITHRRSTLSHCDFLVRLQDGRVVATERLTGRD